ncbi:hypothetical protein CHS0354_015754 [Potamilus streckersoni]|uniref:Uncharacterized protein n=1 Tax=Potamilus streckersoni TaxID=2493646 RepID=A0AAE0W698_9BIVA|nr:hypothetical protein CHS0354_015754 [Potamilus streckersoni]
MGFNTASIWIKVALAALALGSLLFTIGYATVAWMTYTAAHVDDDYGLWRHSYCSQQRCTDDRLTAPYLRLRGWTDWYQATQAFETMGLICILLALLIILLFVFIDRMRKRSPLIAIIVFCFAAVVFMVIGFIIINVKFDSVHLYNPYGIGWSQGLAISGCVCAFIAGIMSIIDLKQ